MRLIGIGLLAFLLVGMALLVSQLSLWDNSRRFVAELVDGPQLAFETRDAVNSADEIEGVIYRAGASQPLILTGLPAYQNAVFFLPSDAQPTSGYLQIDATFQVAGGVEGVLRISIDNTKKGELLLPKGEVSRSLKIPLSPAELIREQLVVSISLQGDSAHSACSIDTGVEAVVEIETTSAIFFKSKNPIITPSDRVNAWGRVARVAWPHWIKQEDSLRRLVAATNARRKGIPPVFVDQHSEDAFNTSELREAVQMLDDNHVKTEPTVWPKSIAKSGSNSGIRRFYRKNTWRENYQLRAHNAGVLLDHLDLQLHLGRQMNGGLWSIAVTLNKRLVHEDLIEARGGVYSKKVSLPINIQQLNNAIEITVASTHNPEGECNSGPELLAELLPQTVLRTSAAEYYDPVAELRENIGQLNAVTIGLSEQVSAAEASVASELLASLLPENPKLKPSFETAQITVLRPGQDISTLGIMGADALIVYHNFQTQQLVVEPVSKVTSSSTNLLRLLVLPPVALAKGDLL